MKIVIDGNIGCGKSSLIKKIKDSNCIDLPIFNEPLNDWDDWIKLFYSDMTKYSFGFQLRVLKSHLDKKVIPNGIFERSPLSCQKVFGELLYEDKMMTKLEWDLTEEFNNDYGWIPNIIIYLNCDPNTCYKRVNKRNRNGEETISLEYLKRLNEKYQKLYQNNNLVKVIEIDATQNIDQVFEEVLEKIIRKIRFSIHNSSEFSYKSI